MSYLNNEEAIHKIHDALQLIADSLKQNGVASITVSDLLVPVIKESFPGCEIREQTMLFNSTLLTIINNNQSSFMTDKDTSTPDKRTRNPKDGNAILIGALRLTLQERVTLRDKLTESIKDEVEALTTQAELAKKIANGS